MNIIKDIFDVSVKFQLPADVLNWRVSLVGCSCYRKRDSKSGVNYNLEKNSLSIIFPIF